MENTSATARVRVDTARERVERWAQAGERLSLPAWEELPNIPLYMDQIILCLKDSLGQFQGKEAPPLTSSMINNYVKNGVLPHPEKKRYNREHLAALTVLCLLKQVLSLQDVKTLLAFSEHAPGGEGDGEETSAQQLYELFRQAHAQAVQETCRALRESCASQSDLRLTALRFAAEAGAKRTAAERILIELAQEQQPSEEKKK